MPSTIDVAFIKQFEREVHEAYQRQGAKLRGTVRNVGSVKGASTTFQKVGKGTASSKSRHGLVPVMNVAHSNVECTLIDSYAGDWVDKLDELKINIDERQIIASAGAYALGRKTDEHIVDALSTLPAGSQVAHGGVGLTKDKVLAAFEKHGNNDIPDDGQRFAIVGYKQWSDLLKIPEFSDADYVGDAQLPWVGVQAKRWLGTMWMPHSGLPLDGTTRSCFWYHKTAVGFASGSDVQTDITWHGDRAAHFVNNMMSQGAALIDELGGVEILCTEA